MILVADKFCQGGAAREIQAGQLIAVALKLCQGGVLRHVQARQFTAGAVKRSQGGTTRYVQADQLIEGAVKLCYIATDGDCSAFESVILAIGIVRFPSILGSLNGDVAIGLDD